MRRLLGLLVITAALAGCNGNGGGITPTTTDVGSSVATMVKTTGLVDPVNTCNPATPPAPDAQANFDATPLANRLFPAVGFETWRNTTDGCLESRLDTYRALVTFNMSSVSNLKGLVTKAELVVLSHILPSGVGTPSCIAMTGGAASLVRFGPNATLPSLSAGGSLIKLQPSDSFPTGNTVFTFPSPWASGPVAGATDPTTTLASGTGGATFTVDVTSQVNAALNGGTAGMSWMLTSAMEGPLSTPVTTAADCKTLYGFRLTLTHL
jgi:hypothetical protein